MNKLSDNTVFLYQENGTIFPGGCEDFKKVTGAFWTSQLLGDLTAPSGISPSIDDVSLQRYLIPLYEAAFQNLKPLYIRKGASPGLNTLHARDKICKGDFITEYLGTWEPDYKTPSCYRFGPINGNEFRNYGAMIDDGFPNAQGFYLFDCREAPLRIIFLALEDISEGEMITTNYGMGHSIKIGPRVEHRLTEMLTYFSTHPLSASVKAVREGASQKGECLEFGEILDRENITAKLQYVFQTPAALLQLLHEKIVSVKEIFDIYDKIDNRLYLLGFYSGKNWREKEISHQIERLRNYSYS